MDRTAEQLKLMGVFGIYKESYKITVSWRKIFTQITLSLILPLSILYLSQIQISDFITDKIRHNKNTLDTTQRGSPLYNRIQDRISSLWTAYWITQSLYSLYLSIFSFLSTAAVVYAIGSIYSSNQATFKKVISVAPKVSKRLIVTASWRLFFIILYSGVATALGFGIASIRDGEHPRRKTIFYVLIGVLAFYYFIGLVYLFVIWNLASVISVLEKIYGFKALKKSRNLIKGKLWVASAIFVKLIICLLGLIVAFSFLIVYRHSVGIVGKVFLGILFYLLLTILIHFLLVTQTIIYFVCKSYHNENIDRPGLAGHLEASYVHLNGNKDVQLEQVPV